jgi:hypothetical protein
MIKTNQPMSGYSRYLTSLLLSLLLIFLSACGGSSNSDSKPTNVDSDAGSGSQPSNTDSDSSNGGSGSEPSVVSAMIFLSEITPLHWPSGGEVLVSVLLLSLVTTDGSEPEPPLL